jgi:hypothetical protein
MVSVALQTWPNPLSSGYSNTADAKIKALLQRYATPRYAAISDLVNPFTGQFAQEEITTSSISFRPRILVGKYSALAHEVREFSMLEKDWDGYGAKPISKQAIADAIDFLKLLQLRDLPPPKAMPMPSGAVGIYWRHGRIYFEANFEGDERFHFYGRSETEEEYFGDDLRITDGVPGCLALNILKPVLAAQVK